MLAVGDYAPTLSIPADTQMFSIAAQGGKKVVVFFFPRADTRVALQKLNNFLLFTMNSPRKIRW